MKNDEKAVIAGAGAMLAYFFIQQNKEKKEKKVNMPDLSISIYPTEFYA